MRYNVLLSVLLDRTLVSSIWFFFRLAALCIIFVHAVFDWCCCVLLHNFFQDWQHPQSHIKTFAMLTLECNVCYTYFGELSGHGNTHIRLGDFMRATHIRSHHTYTNQRHIC